MPPLAHPRDPVVSLDAASVVNDRTVLLSPVSAVVHPGEALAVTGGNGSGKTTLLTLLCGLAAPTTGTVQVEGRAPDERSPSLRRKVAGMIGLPPFARAFALPGEIAWVSPAAAGLLGFASFGAMSDGFRSTAEGLGRPRLYSESSASLYLAHAVTPASAALLSGVVATVVAAASGLPIIAGATACVCAGLLVLVRAADSARGPLPVRLLTPVPSPLGDAAGVRVVMWQIEGAAVSIRLTVGFVSAMRCTPVALAAAVVVAGMLVLWTARRLRSG